MIKYEKEKDLQNWPDLSSYVDSPDQIPDDASKALLARTKTSHRNVSRHTQLTMLKAQNVDQDFLDEISQLRNLTYLELNEVKANSLKALRNLPKLKTLKINSPRNRFDYNAIVAIPTLTHFFIENSKQHLSLDFLSDAHHLMSIGIEGSTWTKQKIDSLKPLSGLLNLDALFMASVQLIDKDLAPLSGCPNLRILQCARFAPKTSFVHLRELMPTLECQWCDQYETSNQ